MTSSSKSALIAPIYYLLKLEGFDGEDTTLYCNPDPLWCVVACYPNHAEIVDNGYRSEVEAREVWPEAL